MFALPIFSCDSFGRRTSLLLPRRTPLSFSDVLISLCGRSCVGFTFDRASFVFQDDSGFSAPISSGSESNSGDGVISTSLSASSHPPPTVVGGGDHMMRLSASTFALAFPELAAASRRSTAHKTNSMLTVVSPSASDTLLQRSTIATTTTTVPRRESLLSSVRRKMESFSSKRRLRKSFPTQSQSQSHTSSISHYWKRHKRTVSMGGANFVGVPVPVVGEPQPSGDVTYPPVRMLPMMCCRESSAFGWAQLDSTATLLLQSTVSVKSSASGKARPQSALILPYEYDHLIDLTLQQRDQQQQQYSRSTHKTHGFPSGVGDGDNACEILVSGERLSCVPFIL